MERHNTSWQWDSKTDLWICPTCSRSRPEIVRRDRTGAFINMLCEHHDHIADYVDLQFREQGKMTKLINNRYELHYFWGGLIRFVMRFDPIEVCVDCNNADAAAKNNIEVDKFFTFSPDEIYQFVISSPNEAHRINYNLAKDLYKKQDRDFYRRKDFVDRVVAKAIEGDFWKSNHHWWSDTERRKAPRRWTVVSGGNDGA